MYAGTTMATMDVALDDCVNSFGYISYGDMVHTEATRWPWVII